MHIHKEGKKIIPIAFLFLVLFDVIIYFSIKDCIIFYSILTGSILFAIIIIFFFREPFREIKKNKNHILSSADGEIVEILKVHEKEYFNDERIQISIFMSIFNLHQNRAPVEGIIVYQHHKKGAYYPAFIKKSSIKNERCSTVFRMSNGTEIMARQIAGTIAQRIVTYKKERDKVEQGQEYGFIRFGSRVDMFLPVDTEILVNLHQKSFGGKTVIASFK